LNNLTDYYSIYSFFISIQTTYTKYQHRNQNISKLPSKKKIFS